MKRIFKKFDTQVNDYQKPLNSAVDAAEIFSRISQIIIALLCCVCFFTCENEKGLYNISNATIKFTEISNSPLIVFPGTEFTLTVKMNGSNGINKMLTTLNEVELANSYTEYEVALDSTEYSFSYLVNVSETGKSLNFVIKAYDNDGNLSIYEHLVYVMAAQPDINIEIPGTAVNEVALLDTIRFDINVNSNDDLLCIKTYLDNSELEYLTKVEFTDPKNDVYHFEFVTTQINAGKTLHFVFEVSDINLNSVRANYSVRVLQSQNADFRIFTDVIIGAQNNNTYGQYLNTTAGEVYLCAAVSEPDNIDIALFYSANTTALYYISPAHENISFVAALNNCISAWGVKNSTSMKLISMSQNDFANIASAEEIETLCSPVGTQTRLNGNDKLAAGSVVAFQNSKGKYGIIYVKSVAGPATGNTNVDIKIQK
jgi:hypothetical protein